MDLRPALEGVAFPAYIIDRTGRLRWLNSAATDLVGDARGKLATSVVAPAERRAVQERIARKLLGGERTDFTTSVTGPEGAIVRLDVSSVPLRTAGGSIAGIFGLMYRLRDEPMPEHPEYKLTPREHEVLLHLAAGCSTEQMARLMGISTETVRNHVRRLLRALRVHSRLEAVALARREGLIE
jgi:DNA-binding CsgD family transcriptional regulator